MPKHWHSLAGGLTNATGNGTFIGGVLALDGPWTVIRMLGSYVIQPTSAPVAGDAVQITMAIGVVSSDAAAVGASALPDPDEEPDYPWLYWGSHTFFYGNTALDAGSDAFSIRKEFDIRSMRKIKPRESLVVVKQYSDTVGAPPMSLFNARTRVLVAT